MGFVTHTVNRDWREANICGVFLDDGQALRDLCRRAGEWRSMPHLNDRIAVAKEQVLASLFRNAVLLKSTAETQQELDYCRAFVHKPTEAQRNLSYALAWGIACCRYYHALLFILLKECGVVARACGKQLPDGIGYTWIVAMDNSGGPVIIDLSKESLTRAGRNDLDYDDPTGQYSEPGHVWVFAD
ncbi:MAG: hypothetical protein AAB849_02385 [Patescibacteria group bacterium]